MATAPSTQARADEVIDFDRDARELDEIGQAQNEIAKILSDASARVGKILDQLGTARWDRIQTLLRRDRASRIAGNCRFILETDENGEGWLATEPI